MIASPGRHGGGRIAQDFLAHIAAGRLGALSDAQLLGRYVSRREEAAFRAIVHRHGPMVWGVCRRALRDHHDAEDAFQATFLILARKASSVRPAEMLPNWLHGVARRAAARVGVVASRRDGREKPLPDLPDPVANPLDIDLPALLDRELGRLPEKYRAPVILCDLEGKTHREAAEQLGWPIGTVSGRLSRARVLLARRMTKHGYGASTGAAVLLLSQATAPAASAIPRVAAASSLPAEIISLAQGVMKAMLMSKLKAASVALAAIAALGASIVGASTPGRPASAAILPWGAAGPAAIGAAQAAALREEEMKNLEGTWAITSYVEDGDQLPSDVAVQRGLGRVIIKGDKFTAKFPNDPNPLTFSMVVDPARKENIMSLFLLDENLKEKESAPIRLGIYELKGDTLRMCCGVDRPEKFEAAHGSNQVLMTLKWARP